jgi:hypothetical protein
MSAAFREPPFSTGSSAAVGLINNSERAYQSAINLLTWTVDFYGTASAALGPLQEDVCELLGKNAGIVELPLLGGTHPQPWRRASELMTAISEAVAALDMPPDTDPDLMRAVSVLKMNAATAGIRNTALSAFTKQFCAAVASAQAGTLDCSEGAIARRRSITVPDDRGPDDAGRELITYPPSKSRREPAGSPHAVYVSFAIWQDAPDVARARERTKAFAAAANQFLVELDRALDKAGGYVVYRDDQPSAHWSADMFSGGYSLNGGVRMILRVDSKFDPSTLPSVRQSETSGYEVTLATDPWSSVKDMIVMQFFPTDPLEQDDSKRLMSRPQPLDFMFDLEHAREGDPNVISDAFRYLLCYSRRRLERWYKQPFSLTPHDGRPAFYLGDLKIDLPDEWRRLAEQDCPRVDKADPSIVRRLRDLSDYGKSPQDVSDSEFKKIFASSLP